MIQIPLSQIGNLSVFIEAVKAHRDAIEAHIMGETRQPKPTAPALIDDLVVHVAKQGDPATRGPDDIVILPYQIIDDTPLAPDAQQAISTLRATIGQ